MDFEKLSQLLYPNTHDTIADLMKRYPPRTTKGYVTRFAPSPTGFVHMGSFFGAYIDYLLAKSTDGVFYFRLEDTDQKRLVEGSDKIALEMLKIFDIAPTEGYLIGGDYGPYEQSKRVEIYNVFAKELVRRGRALPCFCGENGGKQEVLERRNETFEVADPCEKLAFDEIKKLIDGGQKFALRFISKGNPEHKIQHNDVIKGEREIGENDHSAIIIKTNGIPVYAFAHLVDDTLMHTSIVVRGEEWYASLPLHLELFDAMGLPAPKYAHTPVLMKFDETTGNKRKLSKRHDPEADMRFYLQLGYDKDAVKEYLLTLLNSEFEPWRLNNPTAPITDYVFKPENIGSNNPFFDVEKLNNISKNTISHYSAQRVYADLLAWAENYDTDFATELKTNKDKWLLTLNIDREVPKPRKDIYNMSMIKDYYNYMFTAPNIDGDALTLANVNPEFNDSKNASVDFLKAYASGLTSFADNSAWFDYLKNVAGEHHFTDRKTFKADPQNYAGDMTTASTLVRLAITGKTNSPNLYDIMSILGTEECKNRILNLAEMLDN